MFGQHLVKVMLNSLDPDCPSTEEKWAACGADMLVGMLTKDLQQLKPYCVKYVAGESSKMYTLVGMYFIGQCSAE